MMKHSKFGLLLRAIYLHSAQKEFVCPWNTNNDVFSFLKEQDYKGKPWQIFQRRKYPDIICGSDDHTAMLVIGWLLLLIFVLGFVVLCSWAVRQASGLASSWGDFFVLVWKGSHGGCF